jgi:chromate transport protein ChrA
MWFITSLIAAVAAVWFYDKVAKFSEEVAIAFLAVAILSLVFSLFSAPWQIQLLLLVGALSYRSTKIQSIH